MTQVSTFGTTNANLLKYTQQFVVGLCFQSRLFVSKQLLGVSGNAQSDMLIAAVSLFLLAVYSKTVRSQSLFLL